MHQNAVLKVLRRLEAAEGYLELQMPEHAINELDSIQEAGPFEASVALLRGEAFKGQEKYDDAIASLQKAAQMIPAPHNRRAWESLGECYRLGGRDEMAKLVETFANTPQAPPRVIAPVVNISITIQTPIDMNRLEQQADDVHDDETMHFDGEENPGDDGEFDWEDGAFGDSEN